MTEPPSCERLLIPTHLEKHDVAVSSLPRARSAVVTWITRCCLLNFDEFEHVMRARKSVLETLKHLEIMYSNKLRTKHDDPWR